MAKPGVRARPNCKGCEVALPPGAPRRGPRCIPCARSYEAAYAREWRERNPDYRERRKSINDERGWGYRQKVDRTKCRKCDQPFTDETSPRDPSKSGWECKPCGKERMREWRTRNPARNNYKSLRYHSKMRFDALATYGMLCACCGEDRHEFLTIDHVGGGGAEDRKIVKSDRSLSSVYGLLKRRGWPKEGFRTLCINCNWATGIWGYCPHESGSMSFEERAIKHLGYDRDVVESFRPIEQCLEPAPWAAPK